ncbi:hypothetical protein TNCV_98991 [Trichonephila clavipes]|nr:hypothetical protein TNCV_98991 [Trichonephila clavipes]
MAERLLHGRFCSGSKLSSKSKFLRSRPLHRRNIHAEFKPLHRLNEVSKNGGASPPRTLLFMFQTLIKIEIFATPPLHRRSIHAEFKPLHRLNEVSKKWRSVSFTDAFVHVPNFDQNRNFCDPGLYTGGVFMLSSNLYTG